MSGAEAHPLVFQMLYQTLALCGFPAPVDTFKKYESASSRMFGSVDPVLTHCEDPRESPSAVVCSQ